MKTLKLKNKFQTNATLIANDFIDDYMVQANGEFVKVYLFLLRHLDDPCQTLTIPMIADCLNNTEKDILRAFRYWESVSLLRMEKDSEGRISGLELNKIPISTLATPAAHVDSDKETPAVGVGIVKAETMNAGTTKPTATNVGIAKPTDMNVGNTKTTGISAGTGKADATSKSALQQRKAPSKKAIPLDSLRVQKELKSLLFVAEQYLGKTLSKTEMDAITYFYNELGMSASLIEYLIESCVENNHKSMRYIQKVAISWADEGICTVEEAKARSLNYNKNCYTVLNAFGIRNRGIADFELAYIRKWTEEFGFSLDIVLEAVNRTISVTHQPSFEYADSILEKWKDKQVQSLQDVAALDIAFQKESTAKKPSFYQKSAAKNLNNFERRAYDMDSLEERLLNSN